MELRYRPDCLHIGLVCNSGVQLLQRGIGRVPGFSNDGGGINEEDRLLAREVAGRGTNPKRSSGRESLKGMEVVVVGRNGSVMAGG